MRTEVNKLILFALMLAALMWVAAAPGFAQDATPPGAPSVTDDGNYTNNSTSLHATWTAADVESGIAEYEYAVGAAQGGADVAGWTSSATATEATVSGLILIDGTAYYISVRAKNGAGLWSDAGSSDGITVDITAPTCEVREQPEYAAYDTFSVYWNGADAGSGLSGRYDVQFMDGADGNWTDWLLNTNKITEEFRGLDDHTYYFQCRATDAAGNRSEYPGDFGDTSTTVDSDPVKAIETLFTYLHVKDGTGDDEQFTASADTLSANWSADDAAAGYSYAIGRAEGGAELVGWKNTEATGFTETGLLLEHNTVYYTSVRARTHADYFGETWTSDGILVDLTAPASPDVNAVNAEITPDEAIQARWDITDAESGVAEYQLSIGLSAGDTSVRDWYSVGVSADITISDLALAAGNTYFINVKAKNGAGLWSEVDSSSGVQAKTTVLPGPDTVNDGAGADEDYTTDAGSLIANWTAVAGATGYEYAVGTEMGTAGVRGWTGNGTATSVTVSGLTLNNGGKYFISVRALDAVSVPGAETSSDGITVDTTPPSRPIVRDEGLLTDNNTHLYAKWISEDPESPIDRYEYAIGTSASTQDTRDWTSAGQNAEVTAENLALEIGETYFIQVRAVNAAGLTSAAGASDGITRVNPADVTVTVHPENLTAVQDADGNASVNVDITFDETAGAGVEYHHVQRFFILDNGHEIEERVEPADLSIPAGGIVHSDDIHFDIPSDAVSLALGGRATSNLKLRLVYTGTDHSNLSVTTIVDIPVKLSIHDAHENFTIGKITIKTPKDKSKLYREEDNVASAEITATGHGSLSGVWEIDGRPHKTFRADVSGDNISITLPLPKTLGGEHSLKVKIEMPEVKESAPVSFEVTDAERADADLTEFQAGPLTITDVKAMYDGDTDSYTGRGKAAYDVVELVDPVLFKNIKLEKKENKYVLTDGEIVSEAEHSYEFGALKIEIDRFRVTTDKAVADGKVHFEGANGLPGMGPFHFFAVAMSGDGLEGSVKFPEPQKGTIGIFEINITGVDFKFDGKEIDLDAAGWLTTNPADGPELEFRVDISASGATFHIGKNACAADDSTTGE